MPAFTELFERYGFAGSPEAVASTTLLVARTFSTFRRAYDRASRSELPFGIAYHDGSVVLMPRA